MINFYHVQTEPVNYFGLNTKTLMQAPAPISLCFPGMLLPLPTVLSYKYSVSQENCTFIPLDLVQSLAVMFVKVAVSLLAVFLAVASDMLVGAPVDADINSPEVQDALRFAVTQYNAQSNSVYTSQVVKVIKAQVQVRHFTGIFLLYKEKLPFPKYLCSQLMLCLHIT